MCITVSLPPKNHHQLSIQASLIFVALNHTRVFTWQPTHLYSPIAKSVYRHSTSMHSGSLGNGLVQMFSNSHCPTLLSGTHTCSLLCMHNLSFQSRRGTQYYLGCPGMSAICTGLLVGFSPYRVKRPTFGSIDVTLPLCTDPSLS